MASSLNDVLLLVIGVIGNAISLMVFLAPIPTFAKIYRTKTTRGYKSLPYNISLFNCLLWVYYAQASNSPLLLVLINGVGCVIEAVYVIFFVIYSSKNARMATIQVFVGMNVFLFSQIILVSHFMFSGANRVQLLGWICVAFNISAYAAPMSSISLVIRTKNVQYMPFGLSFFLTLNATAWLLYGMLTKNIFVMIPTIAGVFFGIAQMAIYVIYKKKGAAVSEATAAPGNAEAAVEPAPAATESPDVIDESNLLESSDSSRSLPGTPTTTPAAEALSVAVKIKGRIKKAKKSLRRNGGAAEHSASPSPPAADPGRAGEGAADQAPTATSESNYGRGKRVIEVGESSSSSSVPKEATVPDHITKIAEHIAQISEHIVKIAEMTPTPPPELQAITEESESDSSDAYGPPAVSVPEHVINIAELTSRLELEEELTKKYRKRH